MPLIEYACAACAEEFEALRMGEEEVRCPACGSADLRRKISRIGRSGGVCLPAAGGGGG